MSATEAPQATRTKTDADPQPADVLVIFGITGDLAKAFHSLYRLEQRGLLDCPIVGVAFDDWTLDQLVRRDYSIVGTGEARRGVHSVREALSYHRRFHGRRNLHEVAERSRARPRLLPRVRRRSSARSSVA
jgi:glucose-6-phosphate 1-dehydrogenase